MKNTLITFLGQKQASFQLENLSLAGIFLHASLFFLCFTSLSLSRDESYQSMNNTTLCLNFTDNSGQIQGWYKGVKPEEMTEVSRATLFHVMQLAGAWRRVWHTQNWTASMTFLYQCIFVKLLNRQSKTIISHTKALQLLHSCHKLLVKLFRIGSFVLLPSVT